MAHAILFLLSGALTVTLYALVASGFYLSAIASRHYCFVAAASFVSAPYWANAVSPGHLTVPSVVFAITISGAAGVLYQRATNLLIARGAREGALLIISLAVMAATENVIVLAFGSQSITLAPSQSATFLYGVSLTQWVVLMVGLVVLVLLGTVWRHSLAGTVARALVESPLNLSLRGWSVPGTEYFLCASGFCVSAIAGLLWAAAGRIQPSMAIEVAVVGAVAFIAGIAFRRGLLAVVAAGAVLAVAKFGLALTFEGDWSMVSVVLLLGGATLLAGRANFARDDRP